MSQLLLKLRLIIVILCLVLPFYSKADWSLTATVSSDYLFNGVSQTDNKPALQAGITWSTSEGFYLGSWGSNVNLAGAADVEADVYAGYFYNLTANSSIDIGVSQYTYHGKNSSEQLNYAETYVKFAVADTQFNLWYSWDYFATGAHHYIVMINHTFVLSDELSLLIGIDKSTSLDGTKWQWEKGDNDYIHGQVTALFSYQSLDFSLGIQTTDLKTYGETSLLFTMSKTINW